MEVDLETEYPPGHGTAAPGIPASCRKLSDGVIDCSGCLDSQWPIEEEKMKVSGTDMKIVDGILRLVGSSLVIGVTKADLVVSVARFYLSFLLIYLHR
jgi:hypothetical protein